MPVSPVDTKYVFQIALEILGSTPYSPTIIHGVHKFFSRWMWCRSWSQRDIVHSMTEQQPLCFSDLLRLSEYWTLPKSPLKYFERLPVLLYATFFV